jgi:hypothetical protein
MMEEKFHHLQTTEKAGTVERTPVVFLITPIDVNPPILC